MDIITETRKLLTIGEEILDFLKKKDIDSLIPSISRYIETRKRLKRQILKSGVVSVKDPLIKESIVNISSGNGIKPDRIIETLFSTVTKKEYKIDELTEDDFDDWGSDLFYSWYSHYEYIEALADLRPLILKTRPNTLIATFVSEIRQCYAFQQYNAAYSLCRTLIEACVREIIVQKRLMPDFDDDSIFYEKHSWWELRKKVAPESLEIGRKLKDIYSDICKIIHGRKTISNGEFKYGFKTTLEVVEKLYSHHDL